MRWPGLLEAYKEFLLGANPTGSFKDRRNLPNDEQAVKEHIRGVVGV